MRGEPYLIAAAIALAGADPVAADEGRHEVINRAGVGAMVGPGWRARYAGGTTTPPLTVGVTADVVIGNDNFGIVTSLGLLTDRGTSEDPAIEERSRLWVLDLGLGLEAAPYVLAHAERFEARLHVGARVAVMHRLACPSDRCTPLREPVTGFAGVGFAGVLAWWGERRDHGVAVDAVFSRGRIGNLHSGRDTVEQHPPAWLVRVTWVPFRGRRR